MDRWLGFFPAPPECAPASWNWLQAVQFVPARNQKVNDRMLQWLSNTQHGQMIAESNDKCLYHWLFDDVIEWLNDTICHDEGIPGCHDWPVEICVFRFEEIQELPPCVVSFVAMNQIPQFLLIGDSSLYCKGRWENVERRCVAGFVSKMWCVFQLNLGPSMRHVSSRTMGCCKNHLSWQLQWIHLALSKLHTKCCIHAWNHRKSQNSE